ncbi:MAG: hypothetical protein OEW67_09745 [Cyclobacteriaceae bacterium]|nr:hypothetical protein [Cyclobacteriaceae bacterium]
MMTNCASLGITIQAGSGGITSPPSAPVTTIRPFDQSRIPPGHLPPQGSCKVWYPNKPPGQQPPPTSCDEAMNKAPVGSWVLLKDPNDPNIVIVREITTIHPVRFNVTLYRLKN